MQERSNCDKAIMVSLASLQRNIMLTVFGMNSADRTHMAEISIERSISQILQAETETKQQLQELVDGVRKRTESKNMSELKSMLQKSSSLRKQLYRLGERRRGMGAQMDKLRESKLNMQMLQSMKHTNIALQNIGLKVSDADAILLDLDEAESDARDLQNTLSSSFANEEDSFDLEAELSLMLSDDALQATQPRSKNTASMKPSPVPDTKLLLPAVAMTTSKPPDDPPDTPQVEDTSASLDIQYTDAVAPVSTVLPQAKRKMKVRGKAPEPASGVEPREDTVENVEVRTCIPAEG